MASGMFFIQRLKTLLGKLWIYIDSRGEVVMKINNILKSLGIFSLLVALFLFAIGILATMIQKKRVSVSGIFSLLLITIFMIFLAPYVYFPDRNLDLKKYAVLQRTDLSFASSDIDPLKWYAIYEAYGFGVDSRFNQKTIPDVEWCTLDLEHHTYIVSFAREIEKISYNIWDSEKPPILDLGASFKIGNVTFKGENDPTKVFVYETDKVRVDHYMP